MVPFLEFGGTPWNFAVPLPEFHGPPLGIS